MITCTKCGIEYPRTNEHFSKSKSGRDGLRADCKACERAYRQANKERATLYNQAYREVNRERLTDYYQAWYSTHAEGVKPRMRQYSAHRRQEQKRVIIEKILRQFV